MNFSFWPFLWFGLLGRLLSFGIPELRSRGGGMKLICWALGCDRRQDLCDRKRWCLKNCFAILWLFLLDFRAYNQSSKGPQKPKIYCDYSSFAVLSFTPYSNKKLLGRDPCGDRILRSCLQKGPATALANYGWAVVNNVKTPEPQKERDLQHFLSPGLRSPHS